MTLRHAFAIALCVMAAGTGYAKDSNKDSDKEHYTQVTNMQSTVTVETRTKQKKPERDKQAQSLSFTHDYVQEVAAGPRERLVRPRRFHCELKDADKSIREWLVLPKDWGVWKEITCVHLDGNSWSAQTTAEFPGKMQVKDRSDEDSVPEELLSLDILGELVGAYRAAPLTLHMFGPEALQEWVQATTLFRGKNKKPQARGGRIHLDIVGDWQEQHFPPGEELGWELLRQWEPVVEVITLLGDEEISSATDCSVRARSTLKSHWNPTDFLDFRSELHFDVELSFSNPVSETAKVLFTVVRTMSSDK